MALLSDPTVTDLASVQRNFEEISKILYAGVGSPEGVVRSGPALYINKSGGVGTTLYVKQTASSVATGWTAVA